MRVRTKYNIGECVQALLKFGFIAGKIHGIYIGVDKYRTDIWYSIDTLGGSYRAEESEITKVFDEDFVEDSVKERFEKRVEQLLEVGWKLYGDSFSHADRYSKGMGFSAVSVKYCEDGYFNKRLNSFRKDFEREKKEKEMSDLAIQLFEDFEKEYPHVTVSMDTVIDYVMREENVDVHLFYDYVLSQGLTEEIEE